MITIRTNDENRNYTWVDARDVNRDDLTTLTDDYGISSELLADILDQDEQSRIEKEDDYISLIMRIPLDDEDDTPLTQNAVPLGVILFSNTVITICQGDSVVLEDFSKNRTRQYPIETKEGFVISLLGRSALVYIRILKYINRQKDLVEEQLHRSIMNYELIQLLDIQKSLVYLTTSLTSNEVLLDKLQKSTFFKLNNEDEKDFLEDVVIDTKQAISMANIYADILTGTMDAFASVISNNMNVIMKRLTIINLALMFPTFITGFFGMNIRIPGADSYYAWIWVVILCIGVALIGTYWVSDKRNRRLVNASIGQAGKTRKAKKEKKNRADRKKREKAKRALSS